MTTETKPATHDCVCIECFETFPTLLIGKCPACSSRQIRRANPLESTSHDLVEQIHRAMGTLLCIASSLDGAGESPRMAQAARERAAECEATLAGFYRERNEGMG